MFYEDNTPKDKDKDKNTPKDKDKDKNTPKDKDKNKDKTKTKTKTKTEYKDENTQIQVFYHGKMKCNKENDYWRKRHILWVFWNNNYISELCEKWVYHNHEYAYTRFLELGTYSGEVLFTREHKATISKRKKKKHLHRY